MRKTYMMLLALVLTMMGASDVMAQKIYRTKLDKSLFKAWTSNLPGATAVENPEAIDVTVENPNGTPFSCDNNLFKELGDWNGIFGSTAAYYLWYADLTGTQTMYFTGTPGVKFWVQFNRQAPVEGGDSHGSDMTQQELTIGEDGTVSYDCSAMEYVHLNCIKTKSVGVKGVIKSIEIEGTVVPVVGIKSMINNGDAEGDDLASFPVSWDGPNNGDSAPDSPEIVSGEGVDGSKCFKVTSHDNPTETWHTQFYIKADEIMPKGSKWKLKMAIKADEDAMITTSAQAQPRQWRGGMIDEFSVTTEWKNYTWSGEIGVDDFQSIAFDLNNGNEEVPNTKGDGTVKVNRGISFYFDNIEFGYDLGGGEATDNFKAFFDGDVIRVDLTSFTNLTELVKAAPGGQFLMFPEGTVVVKEDGEEKAILSVEGRLDGYLYIFLDATLDESAKVEIAFTNPEDANRLTFTGGEFNGQAVPSFSGFVAEYLEDAGNGNISSLYTAPNFIGCEPEAGSFNLPGDTKTFIVKFDNATSVEKLVAKLGSEVLAKAYVEGSVKEIILTRTGSGELKGQYTLTLENIASTEDIIDETSSATIEYSFGALVIDPNDQPEDIVSASLFQDCANDQIPVGYIVKFGEEIRTNGTGYGGGARMFEFAQGGDFTKGLYFREGYVQYGTVINEESGEEYNLNLKEGKKYVIHFNSAMWKDNGPELDFQIFAKDDDPEFNYDEAEPLFQQTISNTPNVNGSKNAVSGSTSTDITFVPEVTGDYVIRWNRPGFNEVLIANVSVRYLPNTLGVEETQILETAIANATNVMNNNSDERFDGENFTALKTLIETVNAEKAGYTAPSVYKSQAAALDAAAKALSDHRDACDAYDKAIQETLDLVAKFKDSKFAPTSYYTDLVETAAKYHATIEEVNETVVNEETGEEEIITNYVKHYDVLKDNAALTAANTEVANANDIVKKMFTEGQSHNWYGGGDRTFGYAALHERLRLGVELLKTLGVEDDDPVIVYANSVLGDSDDAAEAIMKKASELIFTDLAKGDASTLFKPVVDEETGEEIGNAEPLDLSVFVKNPKIYSPAYSTEVPGWTSVLGNCGAFPAWGVDHTVNTPYPEDCQIHAGWHPNGGAITEQTIVNLPAGIYTIHFDCSDNAGGTAGTYAFVKTSDCTPLDEPAVITDDYETYFAGFIADGDGNPISGSGDVEEIVVTDGKLTVGYSYGPESQAFINEVTIKMTNSVEGHNYAEDIKTGIDAPAAAKVRGVQVFDLNGRRMIRAQKGLQIVKKQMSDGTIRVEKVIVK